MFNMNPPKTPGQQGTPSGSVPPPPPPGVVTPSANVQTTRWEVLCSQIMSTEYSAWTGRKPKVDCSGLDNAALTEYESPNQLCPASVHSQQKAYNTQKVGLLEKFKKAVM